MVVSLAVGVGVEVGVSVGVGEKVSVVVLVGVGVTVGAAVRLGVGVVVGGLKKRSMLGLKKINTAPMRMPRLARTPIVVLYFMMAARRLFAQFDLMLGFQAL